MTDLCFYCTILVSRSVVLVAWYANKFWREKEEPCITRMCLRLPVYKDTFPGARLGGHYEAGKLLH